MTKPVVNLDEIEATRELRHGDRFDATVAPVGSRIGARQLGYNVTTVAPGKRAFPFHNHHVNEELFFVLEGRPRPVACAGRRDVPLALRSRRRRRWLLAWRIGC